MATRREKRRKKRHEQNEAKRAAIRAASKNSRIIQAEASLEWLRGSTEEKVNRRFRINAYNGGTMRVSNYGPPIAIELSGLQANAPIPILLDHDPTQIVGHADDITVGKDRLGLDGMISGVGESAEKVAAMAANGFPWRASVGVLPDEMEYVGEGKTIKANGKTLKGPLYLARSSELKEVSFVAVAADSQTSTKVAASSPTDKEHDMKFNEWLKAKFAIDAETLSDESREKFEAMYKAGQEPPKEDPPAKPVEASTPKDMIERREADAREVERVRDIRAMCGKYRSEVGDEKTAEIEAAAIRDGSDVNVVELQLLRDSRPKAPAIHASRRDINATVMQAAMARSAGLNGLEKAFKPEVLETADGLRGFGLQEFLLHNAMLGGYSGRSKITDGNLREVLKAAFSVHTVTTMLTQLGHKFLSEGFMLSPQKWREVATTRTVTDFKQSTVFRLTTDLEYEQLGPGGEIQHGTAGQETYTVQAKTYAKMMVLTREDIINDDLGAFDDLRRRLGVGAAMAMNKVFWTAWLAAENGAAFWTSARGNLVTSSAFGDTGIATALAAFRGMSHPDGSTYHNLDLEPVKVLVGPTLEATALKYYNSAEIRNTTASTKTPTTNIWQNRFRPVVVPQLENTNYTGYSTTNWWMLADPMVLASAVVSFLNGNETPIVETADADFNTLGIQLRGYHDFGVDMSEYRASVEAQA